LYSKFWHKPVFTFAIIAQSICFVSLQLMRYRLNTGKRGERKIKPNDNMITNKAINRTKKNRV
jgi:hypothetical protein